MPLSLAVLVHQLFTDKKHKQQRDIILENVDVLKKIIDNLPKHFNIIIDSCKVKKVMARIIEEQLLPSVLGYMMPILKN